MYIIAEAGISHLGDMETAKDLINAASLVGASAVKFQLYKTEKLIGLPENLYKDVKKAELSKEQVSELKDYCDNLSNSIEFICSPFDIDSLYTLFEIGLDIIKIPSGQITSKTLLREAATAKTVIISSGLSNLDELKEAVDILSDVNLYILHCTSAYPTPYEDINLNAIKTLKQYFKYPIGLSDHSEGIEIPIAAAALGIEILEKHFTLIKNYKAPDQKISLDPITFLQMIQNINNVERAMGNGIKKVEKSAEKLLTRKDYR